MDNVTWSKPFMNKRFSSGAKMLWRNLAIALASLTILAEIVLAISAWGSPSRPNGDWSESVYPILFALLGVATLVAWLTYQPSPAMGTGQQASPTQPTGE